MGPQFIRISIFKVSDQGNLLPTNYYLHEGKLRTSVLHLLSGKLSPFISYMFSGKLCPVISLLNVINRVNVSLIIQRVYLKWFFLRINPHTISTCQWVYLSVICSTITYNYPFITEHKAIYHTSTISLVFPT